MKKLLLLTLIFITSLFANKVVYLSYDEMPQRVVKGEIFSITLKSISTVKKFNTIDYEFSNSYGLKSLDTTPLREKKGKYNYETFHFLTTSGRVRLPDIKASLEGADRDNYSATLLKGHRLNVITLNPKRDFSNIIANSLELVDYKTTSYDAQHNIVIIVAKAENSNIKAMHFKNVFKQGIESAKSSYLNSRITYYVVIKKELENFSFSYFNLLKNRFNNINIPIIVDDDSVVTQSDLKPKDQSHERLKIQIASAFAFIAFIFILWRKKYIYLIFMLIPLIYIIYLMIPEKEVCIKKGSKIHLLPVKNGTIFETTKNQYNLTKEGHVKEFVKVKLKNNKIGWVENEDICSF